MARKCPVCRSKEWYKQPSSGLLVCSEGHVLQNYRNETNERTELGPHMVKQRRLKSLKKKKKGFHEDETVYYGPQARYLYFEVLQLILRMQISFLTKEWNLPAEFELICRDIWSFHLNLLHRPPKPEPYLVRCDGINSQNHAGVQIKGPPDSESDVEAQQSELKDLLEDMSEVESSGDEDVNTANKSSGATPGRSSLRNKDKIFAGTVAVLMMACWLSRIPVMYIDMIRLIEAYKLPYLEAVRLLPEELTKHLTQTSKNNLSPYSPPSVSLLHGVTSRLAVNVWNKHSIHTPEMNSGWLLWRIVKGLGGNATLYKLVKMMAMELNLPMTLAPGLAPDMNGMRMKSDNLPVEVSLMAALIIVLKLKYDFQNNTSNGKEERKRGLVLVSENQGEMSYLDCGKELAMNELNDDEVDSYLAFCERALLPGKTKDKIVSEFFTTRTTNNPESTNISSSCSLSDTVLATIRMVDRDVAGPIKIFHVADSSGILPEIYSEVLGVGARFVGVGLEELGNVIERFERRLVRFCSQDPKQ